MEYRPGCGKRCEERIRYMEKFYSVAIDGPGGAGKSTLAKAIAKDFGFIYVDTGAIYRTLALACINRGIACNDEELVKAIFPEIKIEIKYDSSGVQRMYLDGEDVSDKIRTPEISIGASDVSSLPAARSFLLDMQRSFAKTSSVVMDGRDIGTVVLPDADVKIYLTAPVEKRAERRFLELQQKGTETTYEDVLKDMQYRDNQDMNRTVAPLKKADDAIEADTGDLTLEQSLALLESIIRGKINV